MYPRFPEWCFFQAERQRRVARCWENPQNVPTQTDLGPNSQRQAKTTEARLWPSYDDDDDDDDGKGDCHKVMSGGESRKWSEGRWSVGRRR